MWKSIYIIRKTLLHLVIESQTTPLSLFWQLILANDKFKSSFDKSSAASQKTPGYRQVKMLFVSFHF